MRLRKSAVSCRRCHMENTAAEQNQLSRIFTTYIGFFCVKKKKKKSVFPCSPHNLLIHSQPLTSLFCLRRGSSLRGLPSCGKVLLSASLSHTRSPQLFNLSLWNSPGSELKNRLLSDRFSSENCAVVCCTAGVTVVGQPKWDEEHFGAGLLAHLICSGHPGFLHCDAFCECVAHDTGMSWRVEVHGSRN